MRYFFEVAYNGSAYSGFQIQDNANTIQAEVEKALSIYCKQKVSLTGSSRTDAGVHAFQNYFHGDTDKLLFEASIYNLNAILPNDIVLKSVTPVHENAHSRFDAVSRQYIYHIYQEKNPFLQDRAYYYPYSIDLQLLNLAAAVISKQTRFAAFSKKNSQATTDLCNVEVSTWRVSPHLLEYNVRGNRFLRGMVRALVATMLRVGRGQLEIDKFESLFSSNSNKDVDFAAPAHGLYLNQVQFHPNILR